MAASALPLFPSPPPRLRWVEPDPPDPIVVELLAAELGLPLALCRLLAQRGHGSSENAKSFLRPRRDHVHSPNSLAGMAAAAERIARAVKRDEVILVHGDYDVDGVCGTALLTRALTMMGGRVVPFVPHRLHHGYDLGTAGVEAALAARSTLIVTTDCGIVAHDAVRHAASTGIDVVVTDHHTPGDALPPAAAVVNPNRIDCSSPEKGLAGCGVAFKLAVAVAEVLGFDPDRLSSLVDLVAMATIADLAPLTPENRAIVRWGLAVLVRTPNPGLRALLATTGLADRDEITAGQVGFVLAPRINAVGRVGDPMAAVRLLLTDDPQEAESLARLHESENHRRRELDESTLEDALGHLERAYDPANDWGVVLASDGWHPGVIGIVASRIVERIHRPTVLIAVDNGIGKGSGRSIPGFHLQRALVACSGYLERFGGHRAAAGCSLRADRIDAFRDAFNAHAHAALDEFDLLPRLRLDGALALGEATPELLRLLRHFAPFGVGNPTPVFASYGVTIESPRIVGRGHLKVTLRSTDVRLDAIGFDMADRLPELAEPARFDVAFRLEENDWVGKDGRVRYEIQARLAGFRGAE